MATASKGKLEDRLVLIAGDEEILRTRALADLLHAVGMQKDDFDLQSYTADAVAPMEWIGSAGTAPFMADKRCVIVRNVLRVEPDAVDRKALESLPDYALLILIADDEAGTDDKLQRMKRVQDAWQKLVQAIGGKVLKFDLDAKKAKDAVLLECRQMNLTISPTAVDALVEMTGGSLSRAFDELEKVVLFVGPDQPIREPAIREIVVPSREWSVFRMVESILEGRVPEALKQLRILVSSTSKAEDTAFRNILPVTSNQLRLIWQARVLLDAGQHAGNAKPETVALLASKPNFIKERDWRQNRCMGIARKVSLARLTRCLIILSDTDARLKGMLGSFNAMETLERMVLEMAAVAAG